MLIGRDAERAEIRARLYAARSGTSSVLVVCGEPGIGKSSLLADAQEAATGPVLSTVGMEGESGIAYVNLADVFRHHLDRLDAIPTRQAEAIASVFAIGPSRPADRFGVSVAALSLLAAIAAAEPVLITVDDAQWLDQASLDALLFIANRLEADGVVMLFGVRSGTAVAERLSRYRSLTLSGLDSAHARELVRRDHLSTLSEASVSRLVEESGGNPLALLTLPGTMSPDDLAIWALGEEPLPISSAIEAAFRGSVHALSERTQRALLVLAVLGSDTRHLGSAVQADGLDLEDLDPAEDAGLIVVRRGRVEFRHPLVRAAVYQAAPSRRRRRAHRIAAEVLDGDASMLERRGAHLVAAGTAGDETLADTFAQAADREFAATNLTVAGKLYERSAELTPDAALAMRRLLQAANALRLAGAIDECQTLLHSARRLHDDPRLVAAVDHALYRLEVYRGEMIPGRDGLLATGLRAEAAAAQTGQGAQQAAGVLSDAALASVVIGDLPAARTTIERAIRLVASGDDPPLQVAAIAAMVRALSGQIGDARQLLAHRREEIDHVDPLGIDFYYQLTLALGITHQAVEEVDRAGALLEKAVEGARERSAVGVLPFRLGSLARIDFWRGRWARSRAAVHEALRLATDTGWVNERPSSLATLARLEAVTGEADSARTHAHESVNAALAAGAQTYAALAWAALGLLELTDNRPAVALDHFARVSEFADAVGFANSPALWWSADYVECLVLEGDLDRARGELARLTAMAAQPDMPTTVAVAARCRALVEPDRFLEHMAEALRRHTLAGAPFEHARTSLLLGEHLRRHGQPKDSREHLKAALTVFDRLGAAPWAQRTRHELEAAGVRVRPSRPEAGLGGLSPQELQVALTVARGLSNKETAAELFLSPKTIEFHLSNVYAKLALSRRSQLTALVARHETASL